MYKHVFSYWKFLRILTHNVFLMAKWYPDQFPLEMGVVLWFSCFTEKSGLGTFLPPCSIDTPLGQATSKVICPLLGLAQSLLHWSWYPSLHSPPAHVHADIRAHTHTPPLPVLASTVSVSLTECLALWALVQTSLGNWFCYYSRVSWGLQPNFSKKNPHPTAIPLWVEGNKNVCYFTELRSLGCRCGWIQVLKQFSRKMHHFVCWFCFQCRLGSFSGRFSLLEGGRESNMFTGTEALGG